MRPYALAIYLILLPAILIATTIHVPADQPTIQAGINMATYGDTVIVECGNYFEYLISMKDGVVLRSETGLPDCVTIHGGYLLDDEVFHFYSLSPASVVEGFTITGGGANTEGAIYCFQSSPIVRACVFMENLNGGMKCKYSTPTIVDCTFINNGENYRDFRNNVSALWLHNSQGSGDAGFVDGCIFKGNQVGIDGGAINMQAGSATIVNCLFEDNYAGNQGGAIFITSYGPYLDIQNCTFWGNTSAEGASAIHCLGVGSGATISRSIVWGNTGQQIWTSPSSEVVVFCSDIQGGWDGPWNIDLNPEFCDAQGSDFTLWDSSPCAPDNNECEALMGAYHVGCWHPTSVPEDGQVVQSTWSALKSQY